MCFHSAKNIFKCKSNKFKSLFSKNIYYTSHFYVRLFTQKIYKSITYALTYVQYDRCIYHGKNDAGEKTIY